MNPPGALRLSEQRAQALVQFIAPSLDRNYPYRPALVLSGDEDAQPPRAHHPIFATCFDWHSSVHSHWALVRLVRLFPHSPWTETIWRVLDGRLSTSALAIECATVRAQPGFETPYGMAWLLQLHGELCEARREQDAVFSDLCTRLEPLAALAKGRLATWIAKLPFPIRTGTHDQSALAMALFFDWAAATGDQEQRRFLEAKALALHGSDRDAPVGYEPSAHDFLSPSLAVADLMRRVLAGDRFQTWLGGFLPHDLAMSPVATPDLSDGRMVHLDGLNLSRAWMLRGIASGLPGNSKRRSDLEDLAGQHERAGLARLEDQGYAGSHWLGSFAVYACSDRNL